MLVLNCSLDGNRSVKWRRPAANHRVLQIIARVTSGRGQLRPTQFCIGPGFSSLPGLAAEKRQRQECLDPVSHILKLSVAITPVGSWLSLFLLFFDSCCAD